MALAYHVDYWNYLGWEDPFSMPQFTQRQYAYAHKRGSRTVYTPQVLINGKEFRSWHSASANTDIERVARTAAGAHITLSLKPINARDFNVAASVSLSDDIDDATLYLALYENELANKIEDGENAGRTLRHDFVTRRLYGPFPIDSKSPTTINQQMHVEREWKKKELGVVAFVQRRNDNGIVQSIAQPLCF